jgi:hypothetical protein
MSHKSENSDINHNAVCAPGIKYLGGSCISIDILEDMVNIYNADHRDKIDLSPCNHMKNNNPIGYKLCVVRLLNEKLKNKCDNQTCWLSLPFFKSLSDPRKTIKLHKYTFLPDGPRNTTEWLNTNHINDVFTQYENIYKDFKFMGANPRDFENVPETGISKMNLDQLQSAGKTKLGFVFNLDKHNQSGSHWVSMFADLLHGNIYFIDSVGHRPMHEFRKLMNKLAIHCFKKNHIDKNSLDIRYNKTQHQYGDTECGVYSISFILRLLDGETFDDINGRPINDDEMKQCRLSYFR